MLPHSEFHTESPKPYSNYLKFPRLMRILMVTFASGTTLPGQPLQCTKFPLTPMSSKHCDFTQNWGGWEVEIACPVSLRTAPVFPKSIRQPTVKIIYRP